MKCPTCDWPIDPRNEACAKARIMPDDDDRSIMATATRAAETVDRWPSRKARRCTCAGRRRAHLERAARDAEAIAAWVAGDGTDAQRVALADGVRAGLWIPTAELEEDV